MVVTAMLVNPLSNIEEAQGDPTLGCKQTFKAALAIILSVCKLTTNYCSDRPTTLIYMDYFIIFQRIVLVLKPAALIFLITAFIVPCHPAAAGSFIPQIKTVIKPLSTIGSAANNRLAQSETSWWTQKNIEQQYKHLFPSGDSKNKGSYVRANTGHRFIRWTHAPVQVKDYLAELSLLSHLLCVLYMVITPL